MGNCTSKKSRKSLKLSAKSLISNKMNKDQDTLTKGLSKKIAPFNKGEVTSFGFKKKFSSQLPVPITLSSNGHSIYETNEKPYQNGVAGHKNLSDGYQSGSSVESLCHAPFRSTPKMVRKRDLVKQVGSSPFHETEVNPKNEKSTSNPGPVSLRNGNDIGRKTNPEPTVNRFGFRQQTPPRVRNNSGKGLKKSTTGAREGFLTSQDTSDTVSYSSNKKVEVSVRSRSEGPREAFFKETLQPANSVQFGLNQSKPLQPGKFTFQTSHLPRPQYPQAVKMSETKTAKTAANYYRKGGTRNDSNSLRDGFTNEDSGFESHPSANNSTLERHIEILESSPGSKVRRNLPTLKGKKLEMKIFGNKFELLKKDEEASPDIVTEISLIKLPTSNIRNSTAVINTGLVEQRTSQYLKKISQPFNKKEIDSGARSLNKVPLKSNRENSDSKNRDEGLGAESEEEKLFKDCNRSEKSSAKYLMSDGYGEDMLPGETMAEDVSLCLSFEEDLSTESIKNPLEKPAFVSDLGETPNTIRLDALKLSKQLKCKNNLSDTNRTAEDSASKFFVPCEKDEDTFPSDSILEQLSDSDSLGDKGEDKNNDKEKNLKVIKLNLDKEDLDIEVEEEENSKEDTDVDDNDLELNLDETEIKDDNKNCLGTNSPDSPGTPTHASNSLSLSDGRDFLIDDEIADQPQLCLSESYVDCSYKEEVKTPNEKTTTVNEFVSCCNVQTNTIQADENESLEKYNESGNVHDTETEVIEKAKSKERRKLSSEETLSSCESISSDDLILDFEMNSVEETAGRFDVNENNFVDNSHISTNQNEMREFSCKRLNARSEGEKFIKTKEETSVCNSPASAKSLDAVSCAVCSCGPYWSPKSTPVDEDSFKLDKISYQNMFEDIVGIKAMLLKLKRLLLESEGGLQENGRIYPMGGVLDNVIEDELTDLRRQVLFLQQQLEEREKMVQVLKLKISQTNEPATIKAVTESRKKSNAATQTGLDQFQQDFPHFRIFQTTPVV